MRCPIAQSTKNSGAKKQPAAKRAIFLGYSLFLIPTRRNAAAEDDALVIGDQPALRSAALIEGSPKSYSLLSEFSGSSPSS